MGRIFARRCVQFLQKNTFCFAFYSPHTMAGCEKSRSFVNYSTCLLMSLNRWVLLLEWRVRPKRFSYFSCFSWYRASFVGLRFRDELFNDLLVGCFGRHLKSLVAVAKLDFIACNLVSPLSWQLEITIEFLTSSSFAWRFRFISALTNLVRRMLFNCCFLDDYNSKL